MKCEIKHATWCDLVKVSANGECWEYQQGFVASGFGLNF